MELHDILFIITTISMFFSGYSFRKKSILGVIISSLSVQIPFLVDLVTMGTSKIGQGVVDAPNYIWLVAIAYVIFIWGMGYIVGGINLKKKDKSDDFPGKSIEYTILDFDKNK